MSGKGRVVSVALLMAASSVAVADSEVSMALDLGYRQDKLTWNIAGAGVNILSELKWTDMAIFQPRLRLSARSDALQLMASFSAGTVQSGDNQDSDYLFSDRQGEFSRSNNRAGGTMQDGSIGVGYRFEATGAEGRRVYFMPTAGISIHEQALTMSNGVQTVSTAGETPPLGPIAGLNSRYDAHWHGGWVGASFIGEEADSGWRLSLDIAAHAMQYRAEADWNLRDDFLHPVSFTHEANGGGLTLALNSMRPLGAGLAWLMGFEYGQWRTASGVDTVFLSDGSYSRTRLNRVEWQSMVISTGLAWRF